MNILEGISEKDLAKKTIVIAILAILFAGAGTILNFWHPKFTFFEDWTIGGWIFATEIFAFAVVMLTSYFYQLFKGFSQFFHKHP